MKKVEVKVDPSLFKELVGRDKIFRSTCDYHLTERDLEKARKELKETDVKRKTCLEELKKLLSKDKRMRYRMDDDYLLRFLRYRKFDLQKTYKSIQQFYTVRNEDPLLFTLCPEVESKMRGEFGYLMPNTNDSGEIVFIHRLGHWNPSEVSMRDFCGMFNYSSDVTTMNPHAQIDGVIDIFDFAGIAAGQLSELLKPPSLKLLSKTVQELYPWRIKKVVFFNCSAVVYGSIYVLCCIMKKKISDRIVIIRSDLGELHKHVNPAILPREYGGNLDDEKCSSYLKKIVFSNKEYLRYEHSFIGYKK